MLFVTIVFLVPIVKLWCVLGGHVNVLNRVLLELYE